MKFMADEEVQKKKNTIYITFLFLRTIYINVTENQMYIFNK